MPEYRSQDAWNDNDPCRLPDRDQEIVQEIKHDEGECKVEERKDEHGRRLGQKDREHGHNLCPGDNTEDETEKDHGLDYGKNEGKKKFFLFRPQKPLGVLAEYQPERGPDNGKQFCREEKKE
jgi:hypothetical protein